MLVVPSHISRKYIPANLIQEQRKFLNLCSALSITDSRMQTPCVRARKIDGEHAVYWGCITTRVVFDKCEKHQKTSPFCGTKLGLISLVSFKQTFLGWLISITVILYSWESENHFSGHFAIKNLHSVLICQVLFHTYISFIIHSYSCVHYCG